MHLLENVVTVNIFTAEWVSYSAFFMIQSKEYIDNLKQLAFVLPCSPTNLVAGIPYLVELLEYCGFDKDSITIIKQNQGVGNIVYVPSFIKSKDEVGEFEKAFDLIVARDEFKKWKLKEHRNNLLLLILLLHDYYFLDADGNPLYRIKGQKPFHDLPYEDMPDATQMLMNGKEVADLLEILLNLQQKSNTLHMQVGTSHALITHKALRSKLAESIESTLLQSSHDALGFGFGLVTQYVEYQRTGNDTDLKKGIKAIKSIEKISPAPLYNKAISRFSLSVRNYLVHDARQNTLPLWPKDLLTFIEATFALLKVDYQASSGSIKALRRTIADYTKAHRINPEEIVSEL